MAVVYSYKNQGVTISIGSGITSHSAIAGDKYTDTATGLAYSYTTYWILESNLSNTTRANIISQTPVAGTSGFATLQDYITVNYTS